MRVKLHVFSNGNAIFEFDGNTRSSDIELFRNQYLAGGRGALFFVGMELAIIEHMNPLLTVAPQNDHVDQDQQA